MKDEKRILEEMRDWQIAEIRKGIGEAEAGEFANQSEESFQEME